MRMDVPFALNHEEPDVSAGQFTGAGCISLFFLSESKRILERSTSFDVWNRKFHGAFRDGTSE